MYRWDRLKGKLGNPALLRSLEYGLQPAPPQADSLVDMQSLTKQQPMAVLWSKHKGHNWQQGSMHRSYSLHCHKQG
eukprot:6478193-Amphidinium_carterae.1